MVFVDDADGWGNVKDDGTREDRALSSTREGEELHRKTHTTLLSKSDTHSL